MAMWQIDFPFYVGRSIMSFVPFFCIRICNTTESNNSYNLSLAINAAPSLVSCVCFVNTKFPLYTFQVQYGAA